jgi:hypothetical protein
VNEGEKREALWLSLIIVDREACHMSKQRKDKKLGAKNAKTGESERAR